jgi:hypothetical protein
MARKNCTEYPIQNYHCQLGTYAMAFGKIILTLFSDATIWQQQQQQLQ